MSSAESSKELTSLIRTLRSSHGASIGQILPTHGMSTASANASGAAPAPRTGEPSVEPVSATTCGCNIEPEEPLLGQFVRSFLTWESTSAKAAQALKRLEQAVVDFNELRACMPDELVKIIGERFPRAAERALRLRTALNVVYSREHQVSLEHVAKMDKREARSYLEGLDGVPGYVSSRVMLIGLSHHCAPVDSRILRRLVEAKVVPETATAEQAASVLEKKLRPGELPEAYALLQLWADEAQYAATESHLSSARPKHKPVSSQLLEQREVQRKLQRSAKRKSTLSARESARKRPARGAVKSRKRGGKDK